LVEHGLLVTEYANVRLPCNRSSSHPLEILAPLEPDQAKQHTLVLAGVGGYDVQPSQIGPKEMVENVLDEYADGYPCQLGLSGRYIARGLLHRRHKWAFSCDQSGSKHAREIDRMFYL
jgi:hypothetical protein